MVFGKPFGWYGRLSLLVVTLLYWTPWVWVRGVQQPARHSVDIEGLTTPVALDRGGSSVGLESVGPRHAVRHWWERS